MRQIKVRAERNFDVGVISPDEFVMKGYLARLRCHPRQSSSLQVISWNTSVTGATIEVSYRDSHRNDVIVIGGDEKSVSVAVVSEGILELSEQHGVLGKDGLSFLPDVYAVHSMLSIPGEHVRSLVSKVTDSVSGNIHSSDNVLLFLHTLNTEITDIMEYVPNALTSGQNAEVALGNRAGGAHDFVHAFISCARSAGFPSRFVSGFIVLDWKSLEISEHCWAEVFVPGLGWLGFDPLNQISPTDQYMRFSVGRDFFSAAPIAGIGYGVSLEVGTVSIEASLIE